MEVIIENRAGQKFRFGGEWFEAGGWENQRKDVIEKDARLTLNFTNTTWMTGTAGYVYFHSMDHSRTLLLEFSNPLSGEAGFTARAGLPVPMKELFYSIPAVDTRQKGPSLADGCAFSCIKKSADSDSTRLGMWVVVLPKDTATLPDNIQRWLKIGKPCPSIASGNEEPPGSQSSSAQSPSQLGYFYERQFVVEVENRSDQNFVFDGALFQSGGWSKGTMPGRINSHSRLQLHMYSDDMFYGLHGVFWFVNDSTFDIYFSVALKNPVAGACSFWASAGKQNMQELCPNSACSIRIRS